MTRIHASIFVVLSLAMCEARGDEPDPSAMDLLQAYQVAERSLDRWSSGQDLFEKADEEMLQSLLVHENDDVAIAAAWQRLLRAKHAPVPKGREQFGSKLNIVETARFLGFLEGRLKVPIQQDWAECLRRIRVWKIEEIQGLGFDFAPVEKKFRQDRESGWHLRSQELKSANGETILSIDCRDYPVPARYLEEDRWTSGVYGVVHGDLCIEVFPSIWCDYPAVCLNRRTGEIVWESEVWDAVAGSLGARPLPTLTIPMVYGANVYVFGTSAWGMYIEGFRLKDGEPVVRFSTGY